MSAHTPRVLAMPRTFVEVTVESAASVASRRFGRALFAGMCLVLFGAPLAVGAVYPWTIFALQVAAVLIFALWLARELTASAFSVDWNPLFAPALAFGLVIAVQVAFHTSAVQYLTRYEALKYVAYALLMFVASQSVRNEEDYRRFATIATLFGLAVALFAVIQDLTPNGLIYWLIKPGSSTRIFGPYANRNHYAGLMEMLAPLPLALAVVLKPMTVGKRALLGLAGIVMAGSVVLSLSRGGMLAIAAEIILLGAHLAWRRELRPAALLGACCAVMVAFVWWMGSEQLMSRMAQTESGASTAGRIEITKAAVRMAEQRPALGWGLGTFATVFPPFRTFYGAKYINEAHNDYAQMLAETGLAGFCCVLWFVGTLAIKGRCRVRTPETELIDAVKFGLLLGCAGLLVHSLVDFNLQIPANAALFYCLAAIAVRR